MPILAIVSAQGGLTVLNFGEFVEQENGNTEVRLRSKFSPLSMKWVKNMMELAIHLPAVLMLTWKESKKFYQELKELAKDTKIERKDLSKSVKFGKAIKVMNLWRMRDHGRKEIFKMRKDIHPEYRPVVFYGYFNWLQIPLRVLLSILEENCRMEDGNTIH